MSKLKPLSVNPAHPLKVVRQLSQVYVELPSSPFRRTSNASDSLLTITSNRQSHGADMPKENAPLRARNEEQISSAGSSAVVIQLKRKRSARDLGRERTERSAVQTKKQRVSSDAKARTANIKAEPSNATEEYPDGFFYCHQCSKKRDSNLGLQCTFNITGVDARGRCRLKYCKACLLNRYGQELDEIKFGDMKVLSETVGHVADLGYYFKCPKCEDTCNCRICRVAKGLEPTGNLTIAAKKSGAKSVATLLADNIAATGILPGKGKQVESAPRKSRARAKAAVPNDSADATSATKPKRQYIRKPKVLIHPRWTPLPVPSIFTLDTALARIEIREFVLRFASLLKISNAHLNELEEIAGDFADEDEEEKLREQDLRWVSATCVTAIVTGLLGLVANSEAVGRDGRETVQDSLKKVKASGANLTKVWSALSDMRTSLLELPSGTAATLTFPDPLPLPANASIHTTRSGQQHSGGIYVATSAQLIPVLGPLVELALSNFAVREELEAGMREARDPLKSEREQVKLEMQRWGSARHSTPALHVKAARARHKHVLSTLEQARRLTSYSYMSRFIPLGRDHEGRVYFALSPNIAEREAAFALLDGKAKAGGKARGRAVVSEEDRQSMTRWSWFVSVWGRKPGSTKTVVQAKEQAKSIDSDSNDEDDTDVEKWWGFWQSEEIRKLAEWIAMKSGMNENGTCHAGEVDEERGSADSWSRSSKRVNGTTSSRDSSSALTGNPDAGTSSRASSPLDQISDDEAEGDEMSSLSTVSDSEDGDEMRQLMQTDTAGNPIPSKQELQSLVKNLVEYAEVLEWRVWRMQEDDGKIVEDGGKGTDRAK